MKFLLGYLDPLEVELVPPDDPGDGGVRQHPQGAGSGVAAVPQGYLVMVMVMMVMMMMILMIIIMMMMMMMIIMLYHSDTSLVTNRKNCL